MYHFQAFAIKLSQRLRAKQSINSVRTTQPLQLETWNTEIRFTFTISVVSCGDISLRCATFNYTAERLFNDAKNVLHSLM